MQKQEFCVNHGNALVGRDGTIVLIDCDSFQIAERTRIHTCDVGVPLFTAPEGAKVAPKVDFKKTS